MKIVLRFYLIPVRTSGFLRLRKDTHAKIWGTGDPHVQLVGAQTGIAAVEISVVVPQKARHSYTEVPN